MLEPSSLEYGATLQLEFHISFPLDPSLIDLLQSWPSFHRIIASKEEGLSTGDYRQLSKTHGCGEEQYDRCK